MTRKPKSPHGPPANPQPNRAGQLILETVDNQLRLNDPPETRATYNRLLRAGHPDEEARRLIALAVSTEIWHVVHEEEPFNHERFVANLNRLPAPPWDE